MQGTVFRLMPCATSVWSAQSVNVFARQVQSKKMLKNPLKILVTAGCVATMLAGCDASGRFSDVSPGRQAFPPPPPPQTRNQIFTPAPTGRVDSSPLPPPGGANPALGGLPQPGPSGPTASPGLPPIGSSVSIDPAPIRPEPRTVSPPLNDPPVIEPAPAPQVAARPDPAPAQPSQPTRTSVTGNWNAREAAGGSCRVTLSSTPTLDLYKASSSGCQSREMQRISAWELRGTEIYLYEPGGGVSARLKQSGRNYEGASSKTGAPVTLSK
jgi:hypothetical protein